VSDHSPILSPPPELVEKWWDLIPGRSTDWKRQLCTQAAQWGADQRGAVNEAELQKARDEELEACCEWVRSMFSGHPTWADELRVARHPKPPTLKEQALKVLKSRDLMQPLLDDGSRILQPDELDTILRAVEALPND
jgi:hypothetical protein